MTLRLITVLTLLPIFAMSLPAPTPSPVKPGATLQKLAGGFKFTEGATRDRQGNVFFTDQPNNRIHRWDVEKAEMALWMEPAGRANGMSFDAKGNLIACADETNALWSISMDKQVTVLAHSYDGKPLNGPNDVWVHPDGSLYFTDPFYKRPWWTHTERPQDGEHVYRLCAERRTLTRVVDDFKKPNGIAGTPDGKTLFVADIGAGLIWKYAIQPDGSLGDKTLFCRARSDGMTLDEAGNLYTTSKGVLIFDKEGKPIETIEVPEGWTGNVSFGGKDGRTLYITASTGFYAIEMTQRGAIPGK